MSRFERLFNRFDEGDAEPSAAERTHREVIARSWNGALTLPEAERVRFELELNARHLTVRIEAPYYANAPPKLSPGRTPRLWEHEVVEVFLLGPEERYIEMEFGPHGHYLILELKGSRQLVRDTIRCDYEARIEADRWQARARLERALLPRPILEFNAYAIHSDEAGRRQHAALFANCSSAAEPDFHDLRWFKAF